MKVKDQYIKILEYLHLSFNKRPSIQFKLGNTADLAMVQRTIIDTLHNEGKSQRIITERGVCLRSAVSKHMKCKVYWKEKLG